MTVTRRTAIGIGVGCVAVKAGRQIDGEDERILFATQPIEFLRAGPDGLTQQAVRAESK